MNLNVLDGRLLRSSDTFAGCGRMRPTDSAQSLSEAAFMLRVFPTLPTLIEVQGLQPDGFGHQAPGPPATLRCVALLPPHNFTSGESYFRVFAVYYIWLRT